MASSSSSSSSSSIPVDLESCEQEIANIRRAIQSCAQEISSDLSEPTKARIIGCVSMLARQFEQDFAITKYDDFFDPLRDEILDHLPEFFPDDWTCWITQMDDLGEYQKKNMIQFMIDRMKGKYPSITHKKLEVMKEIWEENTKRYKELVSEFGKLIDAIIEKVKYRFKLLKGYLVQRKKFIEQNALQVEKAKSKKRKFGKLAATTLVKLVKSPTALKAAVAALPRAEGASSSSDYGTNLSTELPEYFDAVVREFWPSANACFLYMIKQNLESKGYFKKKTFQGAMKNPGMLKSCLQYELVQNPENAELKTMYRYQCEDTKPPEDEENVDVHDFRIKQTYDGASSSSTLRSESLPSMTGLGLESRNNTGNTAEQISTEALRPNETIHVDDTLEQSIGESDEEMADENAAEENAAENAADDEDFE